MKIAFYTVEDTPVGKGGMGQVYRGTDPNCGDRVAIKEMLAQYVTDSELRARFHQEVKILSQMEHPSIVKMRGSFEIGGNLYLVMDYVQGDTLEKYVRQRGRLSEEEAVHILRQLLEALEYAHRKGFVHRDIKPSNIMVKPGGDICILDFGIAKDMNGNGLTVGQLTIGSSGYMSPEQAEGYNIDKRSDIYSVGCVLYFMLTGRHAYTKKTNDHETRMSILENRFPDASLLNPDLSQKILSLLAKATRKNMLQRFQSCREFELELGGNPGSEGATVAGSPEVCRISVGRENCDITLYDPNNKVSRHHADIEMVALPGGGFSYIFSDCSANGTTIDGRKIHHDSCTIEATASTAAGFPRIWLAADPRYTLDWNEVRRLLAEKYGEMQSGDTPLPPPPPPTPAPSPPPAPAGDTLGIGWKILCFLVPIVGWVLYYQWKEQTPRRAREACVCAWIGFAAGIVLNLLVRL